MTSDAKKCELSRYRLKQAEECIEDAEYLYEIPRYSGCLKGYTRQGNSLITGKLDQLLADDCRLLKEFHRQRS